MTKNLYPEIISIGSLTEALDIEFEKIKSPLKCSIDANWERLPFAYARVENRKRFSQIYLAAEEKLFLLDFWRDGVCLARGQTDRIFKLADVLNYWLYAESTTKLLEEKFQFVKSYEKAKAFDENIEVEYTWNLILNDSLRKDINAFVELAIRDVVLSKLFPFTSLNRLKFSRCTGYPYSHDTPTVIPINETCFEVRIAEGKVIGRGTAVEALKMVKDNLPLDIKLAIKGTEEDL